MVQWDYQGYSQIYQHRERAIREQTNKKGGKILAGKCFTPNSNRNGFKREWVERSQSGQVTTVSSENKLERKLV